MATLRVFLLLLSPLVYCVNAQNWAQYVNAFIGTQGTVPGTSFNGGNVFPGAAVPFGVVKCGIDTTVFNASIDANGGYTPDGNVTAISMLHESGTGGAVKYGVVAQMALTSLEGVNVLDNLTYMQPRTQNDSMTPGYYKTSLVNGVSAEMSATAHTGVIKYSFPTNADSKFVLVDLSHYLPTNDETTYEQMYSNGRIDLSNNAKSYTGYGIWRGGWNAAPDYQVYFCGEFSEAPTDAVLFSGPYTDPYWPNSTYPQSIPTWLNGSTSVVGGTAGYSYANRIGALFTFGSSNTSVITSKVGVSWISSDKACQFANSEVTSWNLNDTVNAAAETWNNNVFSRITTTDLSNSTRLEMFYSGLYKAHLIPSDRTGECPNWETSEPYYDDYYTIWDTFRCLNPLWTLIEPDRSSGMVRSLIDIWRNERFMPDGRSSNYNGRVQGGSNADNVLADAYVKGLKGINWTDGYAAMKTDAEVVPYNNFDIEDPTQSTKEGRGALPDWLNYGFITPNYGRSISKTIEYSLNDFSLAQVAQGLGNTADYKTYLNRSAGWQNLWNHTLTSLNFTGILAPKYANGSSIPDYDPTTCGACEWNALAYEALPWEYSWTVPFDMETLISFMGGPNITEHRLDEMFIPNARTSESGAGGTNTIGNTLYNPGNEPSFNTPFLYNYLPQRQWKSVLRSRQTVDQYYDTTPSGLPGNSDGGAVDSWMVWNMLGLYPIVTQPVYLLLSPWFSDISITIPSQAEDGSLNGTAGVLRITAQNLSDESFYVQSVTVNGQAWNQSWITHSDIQNGGSIEFVLGPQPVGWDVGALPPSPGHVTL